jgi:hypothetical protein
LAATSARECPKNVRLVISGWIPLQVHIKLYVSVEFTNLTALSCRKFLPAQNPRICSEPALEGKGRKNPKFVTQEYFSETFQNGGTPLISKVLRTFLTPLCREFFF